MAHEITMEVDLLPKVDRHKMNSEFRMLEKELRSFQSGQHAPTANVASRLIQTLVKTGSATTATQARMIMSDLMGGNFSPTAKAVLRTAQNMAQIQLNQSRKNNFGLTSFSNKQLSNLSVDTTSLSQRYGNLLSAFEAFKESPNEENKNALTTNIRIVRRELLKLYQEYRINRRQVPQILRQIEQNTSGLKKTINDFADEKTETGSGGKKSILALGKGALKAIGLTQLLKMFTRSLIGSTQRVFERGLEAIKYETAYGKDVDWYGVRSRAALYNISRDVAASTDVYASDFRQRMMWGEISEREIIGLSRAGKWGRMVMSGEAARNPEAANQAFQEMIATTDKSKMRSILRQLGLSQDLMGYSLPVDKTNEGLFRFMGKYELEAAKLFWTAANDFQAAVEYWSALESKEVGHVIAGNRRYATAYKKMGGAGSTPYDQYLNTTSVAMDEIKRFAAPNPFVNTPQTNNVTVNVNNNMNVNGNVDLENIDEITNKMNASTSKAMYDELVNTIPGARTGF